MSSNTTTATATADWLAYWAGSQYTEAEAATLAAAMNANIYTMGGGWGICPKTDFDEYGQEVRFSPHPTATVLEVAPDLAAFVASVW